MATIVITQPIPLTLYMCDFRLPSWCRWDMHSSRILRSAES